MTATPSTRVGFIGLGNMGSGMTHNLQKAGYALVVNDIRRESAAALLENGAIWADTPAEVAAQSDVVITMLPTPRHVDTVVNGKNGILAGIADGGCWIDMSTSVPDVANGVRFDHADRGLRILDAPVSGMSVGAASGMLQIFVGGSSNDFEELLPIFKAMGDPERILHVGAAGTGYAVKLMINQLWFSHLVATAEVLSIGVKAGVDLGVLRASLIASPANSNFVQHDVLSILGDGDYDEGFSIALACKDLGLSIDLARSVGVPAELSGLVEQIYRRARAQYGDAAGEMSPVRLYEDLSGINLRLNDSTPSSPADVVAAVAAAEEAAEVSANAAVAASVAASAAASAVASSVNADLASA
ncbi:NAD(P)-dependent oxidoreductase [Cryobacterium levicorallinum]|uniref:3-hydroxyisobutyrate dehydrogenase n=1 Tax=Cryobacterium levicorallinum TaxID=995038 RepID=A0A1I3E792_9MICO|nr:NAD(P)-dependent oxidoreductase [Cryobacterium levicorallinum]TFB82443.1 NAD(P)-dependent oxidoreductase [Cryobacterium levicorallinum]GEP28595.1 3-hydroxyisobutyrate dehydrogenase [Cryobacterium levicorallinum]SFH94758.1 3-hydroxyisobutyrate dehydrogenase [Cryobacterium levicorallinum]